MISAPDRFDASTTNTPSDSPLMMRLRCGNIPLSGTACGGDSLTIAPCWAICVGQLGVLRRIDIEHAAGQHGDRATAGRQRSAMRRTVDAPRQTANDRDARARARLPANRSACCNP